MKISSNTIKVLKNFASINNNLQFRKGQALRTMTPQGNLLAEAKVAEDFPRDFAIYDMAQFLGTISLQNDPDINFNDDHLLITSENRSIKFNYADPSTISSPPADKVDMGNPEVNFALGAKDFLYVVQSAAVMQLQDIVFSGNAKEIGIVVKDVKNNLSNKNIVSVDTKTTHKFSMVLKLENLAKILEGDYDVSISSQGVILFSSKSVDLKYWVTVDSNSSKFDK